MPKGPQGQKRPAVVIGCAVHVARIAVGEIEDATSYKQPNKVKSGRAGAKARAEVLSQTERSSIVSKKGRCGKGGGSDGGGHESEQR